MFEPPIDRFAELDPPPLTERAERSKQLVARAGSQPSEPRRWFGETELVRDVWVGGDAGPYQTVAGSEGS